MRFYINRENRSAEVAMMLGQQEDRSLQERLDSANKLLEMVLAIGMSALDAKDAEEQLYEILQVLIDLMNADAAVILLREGNELSPFISLGVEEGAVDNFTTFVGQGFAGKIVETKKHLHVQNAQEDPIVINPYIKRAGIRSMLGVPLLYGGEAIGVLHVDWLKTHLLSVRETEALKVAGERCASAVAIARMCEVNYDLNKQTGLYFDIIEHDLDNLNKVMLDDLDTVLSIPGLDTEAKETVEGVMEDVKESLTIVDNVRKLHGVLNEELSVETMDLDDIVKGALKEVEWPEGKQVDIHYSPGTGRAVNGTELLKDVFYTLFNNAIMCSRGPVAIDIGVDKVHIDTEPYYMVTVADNAQEIPDDVKPELFAYHPGITQTYGKALPLFLARLVVDSIGGDMRIEDRVPGDYRQGTEFIVTLPAIEGPVIPETEPTYP